LEIKFIGTGSGKTSIKRFHSSILFLSEDYHLLVDSGDGISKALLTQNVHYNSIDGILISHLHPDHFSGLSALIIQMKLTKRTTNLDIFINESLIEVVKDFIYHSYIFNDRIHFNINYIPIVYDNPYTIDKNFSFIAKQNTHLDSYKANDRAKRLSFSCSSFLFALNSIKVHYTGDIGAAEDITLFKDFNADILISEISHITVQDVITAAGLLNIKKLVLTHISDEDEQLILNLKNLQNNGENMEIISAYDGLSISI
jgi:ribonuclease Z